MRVQVPPRARPNLRFESSQRLDDWTPSNQEPSAWLGSCRALYFCAGAERLAWRP